MDAFYASVEQRDNPELRGKPVAVGGSRERGVVAAASYEARKFGVRSAMPSVTARRKCPELIFVKPRFDVYRAVSHQIRAIFAEYTPLIEPLSLDEAYLDVTENLKAMASATAIAEEIRARIRAETGPDRVGGRLLQQVPRQDGLRRAQARRPVRHHAEDGPGLRRGPAGGQVPRDRPRDAARRWSGSGSATARDLQGPDACSSSEQHFGKAGPYYYALARGIDERPVCADRVRKSVGAETTFGADLFTLDEARAALGAAHRARSGPTARARPSGAAR